jgi:hypothetical protein
VERQIGWLAARGMPRLLLEEHLRILHEELLAAVPDRASEYAVLRAAANTSALSVTRSCLTVRWLPSRQASAPNSTVQATTTCGQAS